MKIKIRKKQNETFTVIGLLEAARQRIDAGINWKVI
jgi:hypothetical protein